MTYIAALRSAALKVVRSDPRFVDHTMADLERYVLSTGYMDAPFPHSSTLNLLYVYAANLRNAGGPGVNLHRFGDMVVGALAGLITENRIAPVHLPELAQHCLAWLDGPNGRPLVRGNDLRYREQLRALAKGDHPAVPFQRHLQSVVGFIDLLNQAYGGCATIYHDSFSNHDSRLEPGRAVVARLNELKHLSGIGVATGLNFIKDSQIARFASSRLETMLSEPLGWFVKPDMHVLRAMLFISGRFGQTGLAPHQLAHLKPEEAKAHYANLAATREWFKLDIRPLDADRPCGESGLWRCVADVHAWASCEGVVPLEIDRLLFLIGSGRYLNDARISVSQSRRYQILMLAIEDAITNLPSGRLD